MDALRKQLLGRHAKPPPEKGSKQGPQSVMADRSTKPVVDVDSDDEGGRTAAFTSRNQKSKASKEKEEDFDEDDNDEDAQLKGRSSKPTAPTRSKRKASSFLDEILEGKKKKKKKQKNGQGEMKA